jgi:hypothetical protein
MNLHYDRPKPDPQVEAPHHSMVGVVATICAAVAGAAILLILFWANTAPPGERTITGVRRATAALEHKALIVALFSAGVGIKLAMKASAEANCRGLFQWTGLLGSLAAIAAAAAVSTLVIEW